MSSRAFARLEAPPSNSASAGRRRSVECKYSGIPKSLPIRKDRSMADPAFVENLYQSVLMCLCARMVHPEGFLLGRDDFFSSFASSLPSQRTKSRLQYIVGRRNDPREEKRPAGRWKTV